MYLGRLSNNWLAQSYADKVNHLLQIRHLAFFVLQLTNHQVVLLGAEQAASVDVYLDCLGICF